VGQRGHGGHRMTSSASSVFICLKVATISFTHIRVNFSLFHFLNKNAHNSTSAMSEDGKKQEHQATVTDDVSTSNSHPFLALPATSGPVVLSEDVTGGDLMDIDEEVTDELDPDWPPNWDDKKKAEVFPIQRPFSQRQWDVFRKLLKHVEKGLEDVERRVLKSAKKPTLKMADQATLELVNTASFDYIMKSIEDSSLLDLNHPNQDTTTLLKELSPAKLKLLYKRSEECGVNVDRNREAEDWRLLNVLATSGFQ
jgi:hypothetical protein